jgi:hypothetical protein
MATLHRIRHSFHSRSETGPLPRLLDRVALAALVLIPLMGLAASRFQRIPASPAAAGTSKAAAAPIRFESLPIGERSDLLPLVTNVRLTDLDRDGRLEVLVCDALGHRVTRIDRDPDGGWRETTVLPMVNVPAHTADADMDGDGDADLVVAVLGNIYPDDAAVGRVELYEKDGDRFVRHVILDDVRRVADVQPGDLDGDGDLDLAVAVFGYSRGEVLWLENKGNLRFEDHHLYDAPGTIHVPVVDLDGDGDLDIAAIVSQDEEELVAFENDGRGAFATRRLWQTPNFDLGSAGLVASDLDDDGDIDLILPAGDNLEDFDAFPQPYHGCYWFENRGGWAFTMHRIADLGGTYAAAVGDLDGDGDRDIALVSMANDWSDPDAPSVVWLENDGRERFTSHPVAVDPIHLVTLDVGDLDGDGRADIVAGCLNFRRPYDRIGRVVAFFNEGGGP